MSYQVDFGSHKEKLCPKCNKKMIVVHGGQVFTSYPAQWDEYWKCPPCGEMIHKERKVGKTNEEIEQEQWEKLNEKDN